MKLQDIPLLAGAFCFLRHGETENNRLGLIAGARDVPLNATGMAQARTAAHRLIGHGIDAVWCSPMQRARATAQYAADALDLPVAIVAQLAERDWGELEGKPRDLRQPGMTPPGAESLEAFTARTLAGLQQIHASGLPLIVAHSGTFRVLIAMLGLAPRSAPIDNCLPLRFAPQGGSWSVTPLK